MTPEENNLEFREIKPDEFQKNMEGGEYIPHDVEITIKYRTGDITQGIIKWEDIKSVNKHHTTSLVDEVYKLLLEN